MNSPFLRHLNQIARGYKSTTDKGKVLERATKFFLSVDDVQRQRFENVWLWDDYPDKDDSDTGVDLVAKDRKTGRNIAIQCKFYSPGNKVNLNDINAFVTLCATDEFAAGILIITTDLSGRARRKLGKIRMIEVWYPEKFDASETINWDNLTSMYIDYQDSTPKQHIEDPPSSYSPYSTSARPYYSQPDHGRRIRPYPTYRSPDKKRSILSINLIRSPLGILCMIASVVIVMFLIRVKEVIERTVVGVDVPAAVSMLLTRAEDALRIIVAVVIVLGIFAFYGMSQRR